MCDETSTFIKPLLIKISKKTIYCHNEIIQGVLDFCSKPLDSLKQHQAEPNENHSKNPNKTIQYGPLKTNSIESLSSCLKA